MAFLQKGKVFALTVLTLCMAVLVAGCTPQTPPVDSATIETDVVVIGGGAAGLAAAIEAAEAGAQVILLEKLPILGGSTLLSGGIVYGAATPGQERIGVSDSAEDLVQYWLERAEGDADEDLLRLVAENSGETIAWLEELGVEFADPVPAGTSPVPRGHTTTADRGGGLIRPLEKVVGENDKIEVLRRTTRVSFTEV